MWIDTHCHLDAPEFGADAAAWRAAARSAGVRLCVFPAVEPANFDAVRELAHAHGDAYALGIHPLYTPGLGPDALDCLESALQRHADDPRLVAVGEIGLDGFVPALRTPQAWAYQCALLDAQLRLARRYGLPVLLHSRHAVDAVLHGLRRVARAVPNAQTQPPWRGVAHAFNGSDVQARAMGALGLKLGWGGAVTFERARRLRHLATHVPDDAWVLETDAPDMPPQWLYVTASHRALGQPQPPNTPAELPRIGAHIAALRGVTPQALAKMSSQNAIQAMPKLRKLLLNS
ncbi:MAG: TatD family hydrolase [Rhodoferax sp.]